MRAVSVVLRFLHPCIVPRWISTSPGLRIRVSPLSKINSTKHISKSVAAKYPLQEKFINETHFRPRSSLPCPRWVCDACEAHYREVTRPPSLHYLPRGSRLMDHVPHAPLNPCHSWDPLSHWTRYCRWGQLWGLGFWPQGFCQRQICRLSYE